MLVYKVFTRKNNSAPLPSVRYKKELIKIQIVWNEKDTRVCLS